MNPYRLRAYLELLIVAVIWGIAGVVIKYTLGGFSPLTFLIYRFAIATLFAIPLFVITGFNFPKDKKIFGLTLLYGFLTSTVTLGLLFFGTAKTTSIDVNLLSAVAPIMIVVAGVIFLKEQVTQREKIGIAIAFAGTTIALLEPVLRGSDGVGGLTGNLLVFASVAVGTANAVLAKILLRNKVDPLFATNLSFIVGFITTLPLVLFFHPLPNILNTIYQTPISYHLGVFYMALASGTLAYYLWHKAQKTIEIGEVGLFAYLYPVFGTPLSVLWLHEKITTPFIIGALIIAIGVLIAEYKSVNNQK